MLKSVFSVVCRHASLHDFKGPMSFVLPSSKTSSWAPHRMWTRSEQSSTCRRSRTIDEVCRLEAINNYSYIRLTLNWDARDVVLKS